MSTVVGSGDIADALARVHAAMGDLGPRLDRLDARIGDGDTGTMLTRFVEALVSVAITPDADLGASFLALAQAGARSTGSSLGTLLVGALMTAGKTLKGQTSVDSEALAPLFAAVRDDMMTRGKTRPGDKTIIDSLDALAQAFAEPSGDAGAQARAALDDALVRFRARPSAAGRARMFAERSKGLDDPGMVAIREIAYVATAQDAR